MAAKQPTKQQTFVPAHSFNEVGKNDVNTGDQFDGLQVCKSSGGKYYVMRTSKKTGKNYREYLKLEGGAK